MTNEELLQETLNATIQRLGKQATVYEAEIANLNAQIIILGKQINELTENSKEKTVKAKPVEN